MKGNPKTMVGRILMLRWPFGALAVRAWPKRLSTFPEGPENS